MDITELVTYLVIKVTAIVTNSIITSILEPNTFKSALKYPLKDHWLKVFFSKLN